MHDGKAPNGKRLIQTQSGKHLPGVDIVWAPPKDVSIAMIYATDSQRKRIEELWLESVKIGLGILQDNAKVCRPSPTKNETVRKTGDLIVHLYTHYTSRPTHGKKLPDIGLHVHSMVENMAWCDDKWRSVDPKEIQNNIVRARYACEANFADKLEKEMGYVINYSAEDRRGNRTWGLAGCPKALVDFFSSRSKQKDASVRKFEKQYGRPPTYAEQQQLTKAGRSKKTEDCHEPSWDRYKGEIVEQGLEIPVFEFVTGDERTAPLSDRRDRAMARFLGLDGGGIHKDGATFNRWQIVQALAAAAFGVLDPEETAQWMADVQASDQFVLVESKWKDPDYDKLTTRTNLRQEMRTTAIGMAMGFEPALAPTREQVDEAMRIEQKAAGIVVDLEQETFIRHMCQAKRMAIGVGWAGTGKTTVAKTINRAYRMAGIPSVLAVCVTTATAQHVGKEMGANWAGSIDGLERKAASGKIKPGSLLWLDEAVMADTPRMWALITEVADKFDLTVRMIGDPLQIEAIGAGGTFAALESALGHVELTRVYRQKDFRERAVLACIRKHRAGQGLRMLERAGKLHLSEGHEHAVGEMLDKYEWFRAHGKSAEDIIINTDAPNTVVDGINRIVQSRRLERGELGRDSITVEATKDKRTESFHRGDIVAFTEAYASEDQHRGALMTCGCCKGSGKFIKRSGERAECYQCSGEGTQRTKTSVPNGTRGTISRVAPWGVEVRTDTGETVSVMLSEHGETQPLRLHYGGVAVRQQGKQAAVDLVLPWGPTTDLGSGYSMGSRGTHELHVFWGGTREALASRWHVLRNKATAEDEMTQETEEWEDRLDEPQKSLKRRDYGRSLQRV